MSHRMKIVSGLAALGIATGAFARYEGKSEAAVASDGRAGAGEPDESTAQDALERSDDAESRRLELRNAQKGGGGQKGAGGANQSDDPAPSAGGKRSSGDSNRTAPASLSPIDVP